MFLYQYSHLDVLYFHHIFINIYIKLSPYNVLYTTISYIKTTNYVLEIHKQLLQNKMSNKSARTAQTSAKANHVRIRSPYNLESGLVCGG